MAEQPWTAEFYEGPHGGKPVERWANKLPADKAAALLAAVAHVLEPRGLTLASTKWLTPLGQGLYEFRVRHTAQEIEHMYAAFADEQAPAPKTPVLLRLFVHFYGKKIVLLLHGYDKGADDSAARQQKEIKEARKRLDEWKRRNGRG